MRGKLEHPRGLLELISVEVERIDHEYRELWLSFEYTCPGGEYKSAMALAITNSKEMTNVFFRELMAEARNLSEMDDDGGFGAGFYIANKGDAVLPIKNLCQRVIDVLDTDEQLHESRPYIDLCTAGYHFKDGTRSLSAKDFEERFKIFMARAREKMAQSYYTIAADDLEKAKILCSTSPLIYKLIGICHRELGHLDLAMEMFSTAMDLGDTDRDTYLYLAEVSFFLKDMEYADHVLTTMLTHFPDDIRAMVELANVRYQMDTPYIGLLDKAFELSHEEAGEAILQTFVFKKMSDTVEKRISVKEASRQLNISEQTLRILAGRHRIPARVSTENDDLVLDEHELQAWAFVYGRYNLLQNEVERISHQPGGDTHQGMALLP